MDANACVEKLKASGCEVDIQMLADGTRLWLVFDPNSPRFAEDGGYPNSFTDMELVRLVEQLARLK